MREVGSFKMLRTSSLILVITMVAATGIFGQQAETAGAAQTDDQVYVAPNVVQSRDFNIFTTFALTNTTPYWFNPRIYLINSDGEIVRQFAPLLKGYGTWQKSSVDLIPDDFQGSVWIISAQSIVASAMIHQVKADQSLSLLGTAGIEQMNRDVAEAMLQRVRQEE